MAAAASKWEYDVRCGSRGTCTHVYINVDITLGIYDAASAAQKKFAAHAKHTGVARGLIDTLWFEKDIFELPSMENPPAISEDITNPINVARRMINEEAQAARPGSGDLALQMMSAKLEALQEVDEHAAVEVALCKALSSGPGQQILEVEMFRALPDEHRVVSLAQAVANLERLQTSSLHGFCPPAAQSKVGEVLAAVRSLVRGQCPVYTSWCGCTNLKKMMDEILPLFLTIFDNHLENSAAHCRGKNAAEKIFKKCEDQIDEVTLEDLAPLCTYDWLLTREQQQQVQQWMQIIWSSAGMAGASAAGAAKRSQSSSSAVAAKKPRASEASTSEVIDNVANLFT